MPVTRAAWATRRWALGFVAVTLGRTVATAEAAVTLGRTVATAEAAVTPARMVATAEAAATPVRMEATAVIPLKAMQTATGLAMTMEMD